MLDVLRRYSKFPLPSNLAPDIAELVSRYGRVKLERAPLPPEETREEGRCPPCGWSARTGRCWRSWPGSREVRDYLGERLDATSFLIDPGHRGVLKQALIAVGYPAEDLAGYTEGAALPIHLRTLARSGLPFHVRDYQRDAADIFYAGGDVRGGSGVIVLPCGAGKTIVGIAAMAADAALHPRADHRHHRRQAVAPRDPRQDRPRRGPGRRVHRRDQGHRPRHAGHLPDPHLSAGQERGISALSPVRPARLGPHHLRRGPSAAGAGVPRHGPHPGAAAAWPDGHAGARGWP